MRVANLFVYFEEIFAYSWVGKITSGWAWTVKNEKLEEVVRSFMERRGECLLKESLSLRRHFHGENKCLLGLLSE